MMKKTILALLLVAFALGLAACGGNAYYDEGVALFDAGDYAAALARLEQADDYKDTGFYVTYISGYRAGLKGDLEQAISDFAALGNFRDSRNYATYYTARAHEELHEYTQAADLYGKTDGFLDADERKAACLENAADPRFEAGDILYFGEDDGSAIEWIILEREGDQALLLSRYALSTQQYMTEYEDAPVVWADSAIREWLAAFADTALSESEKEAVVTVEGDGMRLLTEAEFDRLLAPRSGLSTPAICVPSRRALRERAYQSETYTSCGEGSCFWWLLDSYETGGMVRLVKANGTVWYDYAIREDVAVRPVVRVDLTKVLQDAR